jgi:hypothetical protein
MYKFQFNQHSHAHNSTAEEMSVRLRLQTARQAKMLEKLPPEHGEFGQMSIAVFTSLSALCYFMRN